MNQKISVVLTLLNEASNIEDTLKAILSQSFPVNEIIIVDGGSTDDTCMIIKKYATQDSRIKLYEAPGLNIAQGRNYAIERAQSEIIAVTDGGCVPRIDWLKELIIPMIGPENYVAVAGSFQTQYDNNFEYYSGLLCTPSLDDEDSRLFFGRNSAFTKRIWSLAGGYPEWLYTAEDTLFAMQVKSLGAKIAYAPNSVVAWRPRKNLWKLAKMFFLYGRGNGRINFGDMKGSLFWLRYYFLLILSLIIGLKYWYFLIVALLIFLYLCKIMIIPEIKKKTDKRSKWIFVPIIVFTRNFSTNLGFLFGQLEYLLNPIFNVKLNTYKSNGLKK